VTTVVESTAATLRARPGFEGANIRTWIGFKHFGYLVERAVLEWFHERGLPAGRLFHEYGVGLSIRDVSLLLPAVLDVDDEVSAVATPTGPDRFSVRLTVWRDGEVTACRAKVRVALVRASGMPASGVPASEVPGPASLPTELADLVEEPAPESMPAGDDTAGSDTAGDDPAATLRTAGAGFVWTWRVRYFHCQYSERVQHSGYVRALEEVVDRYLADRGISIPRMLRERGWIPVVSRARIRVLADALLDETVYTTFTVTDVLKDVTYDATMDCYVVRDGRLLKVATATILHGYAVSRGPDAGTLAALDPATVAALTRGGVA
jgi:acyl-CoA thioesterase FadM